MMGLPRQGFQAIAVGAREFRAKGGVLVHEPGLSQVPHYHGRLGFPRACVGWVHTMVEVLCCLGFGMLRLRTVACACRSTVGGFLEGAGISPRCPFLWPRIPYLLSEDGVRGAWPYCTWA